MTTTVSSSILLYRYLPAAAALKSIEHCRLRISRISGLNDPFECRFGYKNFIAADEPKIVEWMEKIIESQTKRRGFISYSKKLSNPVLWGHYADGHKGIVLEVKRPSRVPRKIKYLRSRPTIDIQKFASLQHDNAKLEKYVRPLAVRLLERKAPSWKYEQEYRDVFDLQKSELFELQDGYYHIKIHDGLVTRVILGCYCDLDEVYVERLLKQVRLNSAKVVRAKFSPDKYKVVC